MYQLQNIVEVVYSTGDLGKVEYLFCEYGGWKTIGSYDTDAGVIDFWKLSSECSAKELLLQFDDHAIGRLRVIKYDNTPAHYIRSSQKPWDTGGIMDINLRVNNVEQAFGDLRDLGWHGLSDPLFQKMGPFELYDVLMMGYDDIIVALTHRTEPPLQLKQGFKLPTHIYNSSITVSNLEESRSFYENQLGFTLLNEYEVKKENPEENMFGIPLNIIPHVTCRANIFSLDGTRDVVFQTVAFEGVQGKDFSDLAKPPNRGLLMYRCRVSKIDAYFKELTEKNVQLNQTIREIRVEPYGLINCFSVTSPAGVIWEFFEEK